MTAQNSAIDIEKWQQRTQEQPQEVNAWVRLGDALMQHSREQADASWYQRAETAYQQALHLQPKEIGALVGMAWVCNSRHEFEAGSNWARQALEVDTKTIEAYALLGDAAVECGDYDQAFEHYQACLNIRPDLSSYARAAHLLWLTGDTLRAKDLMQKAIAAGSPHAENTAWCRAELAKILFHSGNLVMAERQAQLALNTAPSHHRILTVMGRIKTGQQDYNAAIDYYLRAIKIAPNHEALVALGDLYAFTGRPNEAEQLYQRAVALHQPSDTTHSHDGVSHHHAHGNIELARFYADHDQHLDEALAEAKAAYQTYKNVFVADTLAWCYYKTENSEKAKKLINQALHWNTPDAGILFHAGMIYTKLEDNESAKQYLSKALSLNPHFHLKNAALATETLKALSASSNNVVLENNPDE